MWKMFVSLESDFKKSNDWRNREDENIKTNRNSKNYYNHSIVNIELLII